MIRWHFALLLLLHADAAAANSPYSEVKDELAALKSPHPWAGVYHGPGAMSPTSLYLAPSGRYCIVTFWDAGGSETGYCGRLSLEGGVFRENLWSRMRNGERYDGPPYVRISWGARRYLVPDKRILEFINAVNGAREPRHGGGFLSGGNAFLLAGGADILVTGSPDVPGDYRPFLLPKPLMTTAIDISPRTNIITRHERYEVEDCGAEAIFDAGASSGVFVGMALHAQTFDVQAEALIREVWVSSSAGRIKQYDCDKSDPIPAGTRFASRLEWHFNDTLSTQPLTIGIRPATAKRFPPILGGFLERLFIDDPFPGAAAEGFSWEEVAEVTFSGSFLDALRLKSVESRMSRAIRSLGGNAYVEFEDKAGTLAKTMGVAEAKRLRVVRLSYRGKAIDPSDVFWLRFAPRGRGESNRYDWKRAALDLRAVSCGQFAARAEAERAATLEALQGRAWETLDDEAPAVRAKVWDRGRRAESEYEAGHPKEAAACRKLKEEADRRD